MPRCAIGSMIPKSKAAVPSRAAGAGTALVRATATIFAPDPHKLRAKLKAMRAARKAGA
jgi:hypothetical protein